MIKTIVSVVPIGQDRAPTNVFEYGYSMAASHDAHLTIVAVAPKIQITSGLVIPQVRSLLTQANAERRKMAEELLETASKMPGVATQPVLIQDSYLSTMEQVLRIARVSDLILAANSADPLLGEFDLVQQLLFYSGRPVLLVPDTWDRPADIKRVLITWDGGAKAARAVGDALALISAADHVEIACIAPEVGKVLHGGDLAAHLSRHCASISVVEIPPGEDGIGATIRNHALLTRADLIVMGAFGHARLTEFVLGGATRDALASATIPTLLSY